MVFLIQDKLNTDYVSVYMSINLIFCIKKTTNEPLFKIVGKMITLLILFLLKPLGDQTLCLNMISLKYFSTKKIIIMLLSVISPPLLYEIVGKLTLSLISSDSFSFGLTSISVSPFYFSLGQSF